jgi:hypothetical protein
VRIRFVLFFYFRGKLPKVVPPPFSTLKYPFFASISSEQASSVEEIDGICPPLAETETACLILPVPEDNHASCLYLEQHEN